MQVTSDANCFVCGPNNPDGLRASFVVDKEHRRAVCTIRIGDNYQGWRGMVHGGIIASLVDEAGIYACRALGQHFVTAELTVKYKAPVPTGQELLVSAEVTALRRKIYSVVGKIEVAGKTLVESEAKVFAVSPTEPA